MSQLIELIRELKGHSGCRLWLAKRGNKYLVRKISSAIGYNSRLFHQMEKQRSFAKLGIAPPVLDDGSTDSGLYFFDMAYVRGRDVASVLRSATSTNVADIAEHLAKFLLRFQSAANSTIQASAFLDKLIDIRRYCENAALFAVEPSLRIAVETLVRADWKGIPGGLSHGDLTLGNIILTPDNTLVLIDFLDGPLSSWWLDFSKLHQDIDSHWFLRDDADFKCTGPRFRQVQLMLHYLRQELYRHLSSGDALPLDRLSNLLAFQLLRAIPYANAETCKFLATALSTISFQKRSET
jgi:aminoglycoside phosphotransferase (APT) family kinase protein